MCDDRHDAEGEANARLVVAAPKLLEALQAARDMLAVYGRDTDSLHVALMENIDAAITEALPHKGATDMAEKITMYVLTSPGTPIVKIEPVTVERANASFEWLQDGGGCKYVFTTRAEAIMAAHVASDRTIAQAREAVKWAKETTDATRALNTQEGN